VPQVVLDKFKGAAGIEKVRRDGVVEAVACVSVREAGRLSVACEQRLDLPLPKRAVAPEKKRVVLATSAPGEVAAESFAER